MYTPGNSEQMKIVDLYGILPEMLKGLIRESVEHYVKGQDYEIFLGQVRVGGYERGRTHSKKLVNGIIIEVCKYYKMAKRDMVISSSYGGDRRRSKCKQVITYLLRKHTDMGYTDIASIFKQHHSTMIYNERTIRNLMPTDRQLRKELSIIESNLQLLNSKT